MEVTHAFNNTFRLCTHVLHMLSGSPWGRTPDHLGEYVVENKGIDIMVSLPLWGREIS